MLLCDLTKEYRNIANTFSKKEHAIIGIHALSDSFDAGALFE